ncbi:hypothetical protein DM01DRAFT_1042466 [Hesseltinella vesiculosa]|uniref:Ras-associating domain-containing protein n=1 Tax=Hesseltinella vesiculosa TaxID=101127 RepID=A0A1X2GI27_9FUNG|nr:hypothetical protein DM01DRAFT_1042466 [Hesseltinella vesiculosa]
MAEDDQLTTVTFFEVESDIDTNDDDDDDRVYSQHEQMDDSLDDSDDQDSTEPMDDDQDLDPVTYHHHQSTDTEIDHPRQSEDTIQSVASEQSSVGPTSPIVMTPSISMESIERDPCPHHEIQIHHLRVFAGNIGQGPMFCSFNINASTTADDLLKNALERFDIQDLANDPSITVEYYLAVQGADGDDCVLAPQDKPLGIFKTLTASLTTPMPDRQHVSHKITPPAVRRKRSSSFGSHEQTSYEEDSVIRFYLHRRIKRESHVLYIKVCLYPDPSPPMLFKKKKMPTTEIDRMDKIIPVAFDASVATVIAVALEKFHVPDSQPEQQSDDDSIHDDMTSFFMSVSDASGNETRLFVHETMSTILDNHRQQADDLITSDLLFILRPCESETGFLTPLPTSPSSTSMTKERRPSILDMLSEAAKESSSSSSTPTPGEQPSVTPKDLIVPQPSPNHHHPQHAHPLPPHQDTIEPARPYVCPHHLQQAQPSSLPPSAPIPGPTPIAAAPASAIPALKPSSTPSTPIPRTPSPPSAEEPAHQGHKKSRKDLAASSHSNSLKQQFKRWVGWGSNKQAKKPAMINTHYQPLNVSTPNLHTSSAPSSTSGIHDNTAVPWKPHSAIHVASPTKSIPSDTLRPHAHSEINLASSTASYSQQPISAPVTPVTPTSHPQHARPPPITTDHPTPSPWPQVDSAMMVHDAAYSPPGLASTPPPPLPAKTNNDSQISGVSTLTTTTGSISFVSLPADDEDQTSADDNDSLYSDPDGIIQHHQQMMHHHHPVNHGAPQSQTWANSHSPVSHLHGHPHPNQLHPYRSHHQQPRQPPHHQQPRGRSASGQQDEFNTDLFLLMTQGVNYLEARERTQWDDDDMGYQYHPWNRQLHKQQDIVINPAAASPSILSQDSGQASASSSASSSSTLRPAPPDFPRLPPSLCPHRTRICAMFRWKKRWSPHL